MDQFIEVCMCDQNNVYGVVVVRWGIWGVWSNVILSRQNVQLLSGQM